MTESIIFGGMFSHGGSLVDGNCHDFFSPSAQISIPNLYMLAKIDEKISNNSNEAKVTDQSK